MMLGIAKPCFTVTRKVQMSREEPALPTQNANQETDTDVNRLPCGE
jgi:hypothetical protein